MKVLVLSDLWLPFPGGAERLQFNLARDLMQRGHDVEVLTGYEYPQQFDGPPVLSRPIGVFGDREKGARYVCRAIQQVDPDVIVTHHLYAYQFAPELLASRAKVVQLVLNTGRIPGVDLAVYISKFVAAMCGDQQDGDVVVYPPAFGDVVAHGHGDAIGFIKPIEHKGVDLFYDIARLLPNREFVVLRGEWQNLETIEELPNVRFMQPVRDIRDFYQEVRMVLMPSVSEDAGTVAQECALNDIPCLSSNVGGLRETNAGGVRITSRSARYWAHEIARLDHPRRYGLVTQRQRVAFAHMRQGERMTDLAARIERLVR